MLSFNEWKTQILNAVPANLFSEEELQAAYDNQVKDFLQRGGDLTLYVSTAFIGNIEGIKWALQHGCDPMQRDVTGRNFWHYVAGSGKVEAIEWALQHGCDPMQRNRMGRTFWHAVARSGKVETLEWALQHGCDPMQRDIRGATFWHYVAQSDRVEALEWALQHGCDPMQKDSGGRTFWCYVAVSSKVEVLEWALQHGCDPMQRDSGGRTFWLYVARSDKVETLEWALQHGCDPMQRDNTGISFWQYVALGGKVEMLEWTKSRQPLESFKSQKVQGGIGKYFHYPSTLFGAPIEVRQLEQSFNANRACFFTHTCQLLSKWKLQLDEAYGVAIQSQQSTPTYPMMDPNYLESLRKKNRLLQDFLIDKLAQFKPGQIQDCAEATLNGIVINCFSRALTIFPQDPQKVLYFVEHLTPQAGDIYRQLFEELSNLVYAYVRVQKRDPHAALNAALPYHTKLIAISSVHPLSPGYLRMWQEKQTACGQVDKTTTDEATPESSGYQQYTPENVHASGRAITSIDQQTRIQDDDYVDMNRNGEVRLEILEDDDNQGLTCNG